MIKFPDGVFIDTKKVFDYDKYHKNRHSHDPHAYDSIKLKDSQVFKLIGTLGDDHECGVEYLENPSLVEFSVIVTLADGNEYHCIFHKTDWDEDCLLKTPLNKLFRKITPVTDFFFSYTGPTAFKFASTVSIVHGVKSETGEEYPSVMDHTFQTVYDAESNAISQLDFANLSFQIRCLYLAILKLLKERPRVFYQVGTHHITTPKISKKDKRNHKNRVRTVKYIAINDAELDDYVKVHRQYTCLCWGVMGHYRTYKKSSKKVWIKPYRKGKQRNNPNVFVSKDYELVSGGGKAI